MRHSSASIKSFFHISSARQQARIDTTITMVRELRGRGKTPRTESPSAPSQPSQACLALPSSPSDITIPIPSSTDPISQDCTDTGSQSSLLTPLEASELDTLDSSASTGPKSVKTGNSDSRDLQGLINPSFSDGEEPSAQATEDRVVSAESKKRSRRKTKQDKAQGQSSPTFAVSSDILPLDCCGPMPARTTSRRGSPIISPKPNVCSPSVSPSFGLCRANQGRGNCATRKREIEVRIGGSQVFGKGSQRVPLPVGRRGGDLEAEMRRALRGGQITEDRGGWNDKFPHLQVL